MRKLREMWATCMEVGQLGAKVSGSSTTHIFTLKKVVALVCVLHTLVGSPPPFDTRHDTKGVLCWRF
jgi:hypothetical protein